ncbi:serine (or cysteine) peptidase inhibitor, clade H, member 2 isoform X2 [Plectropomus leopardus]|uniref:serine (or cysteine) peptidase inhibitor, clade H, member 2 isoform X2 n=1 Tax=Plectropomus leopardus TaxID=160734 RepID=UPI001C4C158B|nr:serine (or cysteine) peptidase inhibitor, clade H, member 2 isoform X2 [Plectropomus leopardus]
MPPKLPIFILISFPVLLVQGSAADSSKKSPAAPTSTPPRPPPPLGDPTWDLGLHLYRALRSDSSSVNTLFSPLLLASSLGALGGGSAGATSSQLQDLLKTPSIAKAGELLSGALKSFTAANGTSFHLHTSSALFSKQAPPVSQAFVKESQARFGLQHQPLGKGDSKADLKQLRGWAKTGLGGLEEAPLADDIQAKAGALIVANALRFKGFYRHHEDIENMVQVLEAPLSGGKASMVLLLPFHVESLARLEKLLTLELLSKWLEKTNITSMTISMPKANITSTLSLQKQLSALGLTDAWDQKAADFSGVSDKGKGKLHLGGVLHWASLELAAQAGKGAADLEEENIEKPKLFYADHPFIIFVRDNATGALLMMGALDHAEGESIHDEL